MQIQLDSPYAQDENPAALLAGAEIEAAHLSSLPQDRSSLESIQRPAQATPRRDDRGRTEAGQPLRGHSL
jgi:hypothetical protein